MNLVPVPREHRADLAPFWVPFVEKIAARSGFAPSDLVADVMSGEVTAVLVMDGTQARALVGCRIEQNGRGENVCHLVWCTGEGSSEWFDLIGEIERWAREHCGCVGMKATARPGWSRPMKTKGYRMTHVVMEKDF